MPAELGLCVFQSVLVATLRRKVEDVVRAVERFQPPAIGRVGVKDGTVLKSLEDAETGCFRPVDVALRVIVDIAFRRDVFRRETYVEVLVEAGPGGRDSAETPIHPLLVGVELFKGRFRDAGERRVPGGEMDVDAVEIVGPE